MKISIITVNKDDPGIAETLTKLLKINSSVPYEIIVVDASARKLDYIKNEFKSVQWYDFKQQEGKKRTIAKQRNYGIKHSKGDIIVFIDANCVPSTNWLINLTSPIINEGEKIVAGSYKSKNGNTIRDYESNRRSREKYVSECPTMNVAFSKEIFDVIGLFDEQFDIGEDVDLCWRATDGGYKIRYAPTAKITHDWGSQAEDLKRAYRYGRGRARLYLKHHNKLGQLFKNDIVVIIYPLYILGLPLTFFFLPYPLFILVPIVKNWNNYPIQKVSHQLVYSIGTFRGLIS
jgi:GT2 family glycosyltransferase